MPAVSFSALPDDARVWVFGSSDALSGESERELLAHVDAYLQGWHAHGTPLSCAREWREGRFLAIGVDQSTAGASGCSIDSLFRILQGLEKSLGTSLVAGGRVFYRDQAGAVECVDRPTFGARARAGVIGEETPVFDTSVTTADEYRRRFERVVRDSWHAALV
jgi:hypothetical protein